MHSLWKWFGLAVCGVGLLVIGNRTHAVTAAEETPSYGRPGSEADRLERITERLDRLLERMEGRMGPGGPPQGGRRGPPHEGSGAEGHPPAGPHHDGPPPPEGHGQGHGRPMGWGAPRPSAELPPEAREMLERRMSEGRERMQQAREEIKQRFEQAKEKFQQMEARLKALEAEVERLKAAK